MRRSIVALLVLPAALHAQALPDARAVLTRYAEATGVAKLTSYHMTGTLEFSAQGLKGTIEGWKDFVTGQSLQLVNIAGLGEIKSGSDSTFGWTIIPFEGPKLLGDKEFAEQHEQEDPRAMRRDAALVLEATVLERAVVDSQPCVKLKLKWKSGRETTECYSDKTGLLIQKEATQTTSAGPVPTVTSYGGYKTFGPVTMATKTIERGPGLEITLTTLTVVFERVDPAKLTPPAEILLLRKR